MVIRTKIPEIAKSLESDLDIYGVGILGGFKIFITKPEFRAVFWIRLMCGFSKNRIISILIRQHLISNNSCDISPLAKFGKSLSMPHPVGIVIGSGVVVGSNVKIMQGVTIGERSIDSKSSHAYPIIGDNVQIGANSSILGNLIIGHNSKIGAHALILQNVTNGTTVYGIQSEISPGDKKAKNDFQ